MLEACVEDEIKSRIAQELEGSNSDLSLYMREFNRRYEQEKYSNGTSICKKEEDPKKGKALRLALFFKRTFKLLRGDSLEEKLSRLAQEYALGDESLKRDTDVKAYNTIFWCRRCRKNKKLFRYYYKGFYGSLKNYYSSLHDYLESSLKDYPISLHDFSKGSYYIEDREEEIPETF